MRQSEIPGGDSLTLFPSTQRTRFLRVSGTAVTSTGSLSITLTKRASATAMPQMTWTHLVTVKEAPLQMLQSMVVSYSVVSTNSPQDNTQLLQFQNST